MLNQFRRVAASMLIALLLAPLAVLAETTSLQYDNNGNITQRSVTIGNAAPAVTTYTYDALNRLKTETGPAKTQTITYDEDGNRLSDGAGSYTYSTTSNRMLTRLGATVTTDPAGYVTADGTGRTFTYNGPGQLAMVSRNGVLMATYTYDYTGRRIAKVTTASAPQGAQSILYDYDLQGNLWYEIDATTNTPIRTYFWNPDSGTPIGYADYKPSRKVFYFAVDHLKTPRTVMDDTGKVVWRWESDAFGSTPANEDPDGDGVKVTMNLRFPGQYYDQESGLHYNYHRYYDPAVGRYTQADPIGMRGGINGYTYVGGNPMSRIDPIGLAETGAAIGGAIGGAIGTVVGGIVGGGGGAVGGTLVAPGVGTVGGGAVGAAEGSVIGGVAGAGVGAAIGSKIEDICKKDDDKCEKLLATDTSTCNGITRVRGKEAGGRCHASASQRYAACLRGHPIPPLDTWNN